jgi:uncharacterized protein DUF3551
VRSLLLSIIPLGALIFVGPTTASAQTYDPKYPVCMQVYGDKLGDRMDCIFTSLPQCKASASGLPAMCLLNPYYNGKAIRPTRSHRSARSHL